MLALVVEPETTTACLGAAAAAAAIDADATIEALHVRVDPDRLVAADEEVAIQRLHERKEGTAEDRARRTRTAFETWRNTLSVGPERVQWRELTGSVEEAITGESRDADLIVLARPHDLDGRDALHAVLFDSPRLLLLVPPTSAAPQNAPLGRHIVIGWTESRPRPSSQCWGGRRPVRHRCAKVRLLQNSREEAVRGTG